ncbi:MAG: virulence factor family protein [Proteobacteria bacterium]|nr:virulence factor family protein [Pseudomonadota bacterium]
MNKIVSALTKLSLVFFSYQLSSAEADILKSERLGELHLYKPKQKAEQVAIQFSDLDGWNSDNENLALELQKHQIFVIGVDSKKYLASLLADSEDCLYLAGEIERLGQSAEKAAGIDTYISPVLIGEKNGAKFVRKIIGQYASVFAGGAAIAEPQEEIKAHFCAAEYPEDNIQVFPSVHDEKNLFSPQSLQEVISFIKKSSKKMVLDREVKLPAEIADFPLIELLPEIYGDDYFVFFLSGDGGWATIDKEIGQYLFAKEVPVIGFNSLKYFWKKKEKVRIASDISKIVSFYVSKNKFKKVVFIGFSMGADVLSGVYNSLSDEIKSKTKKIILLSPAKSVDFEVHISSWIGYDDVTDDMMLLPEVLKIHEDQLQCIYGVEDTADSLCVDLPQKYKNILKMSGDHHYDGEYEKVSEQILSFIKEK